MLSTLTVKFKNVPQDDGTIATFDVDGCLVSHSGSPTAAKPQIQIHLPKVSSRNVEGGWVSYDGKDYHVVGISAPQMKDNTPGKWDRFAIAEKVY